ncbi:MAG: DUF3596 domain-containing protein [Candidatus Rokubacteria bacterium]|nr:DUF3596 domain-containing protein [Candidatus Rokubacteria bacterium]
MGAKVRGRRTRVFSELPATPRNLKILEAKAETLEREAFLGTLDLDRHFPRRRTRPVTVRGVYEEWTRKKATEVTPLTMKACQSGRRRRFVRTSGSAACGGVRSFRP